MCTSLAAYWLFVAREGRVSTFFVGALLGIGVCLKLYYTVLVPVFVLAAWFRSDATGTIVARVTSLIVGIGVLPAFLELLANPDLFMFNNLGFHRWKTQVYIDTNYGDRMTLHARIQHGKTCLQHASQMWVFYTMFLAACVLYQNRRQRKESQDLILACIITVICLLAALAPIPAWSQYFAMPIPFAVVVAIQLAAGKGILGRSLMVAVALTGIVVSGPYYARAISGLKQQDGWTPLMLHDESRKMMQMVGKDAPLIATAGTLIALEGGGRIYPEWALSGFMFELSDHLTDAELEQYRVTSPRTFHHLLDERPPDAIITRDTVVDDSLRAFAREQGYRPIKNEILNVVLWLPEH